MLLLHPHNGGAKCTLYKKPEAPLTLAAFLGRTGHLPEALDVCDHTLRAGGSPDVVITMALEILYEMNAEQQDQDRVEKWISEALFVGYRARLNSPDSTKNQSEANIEWRFARRWFLEAFYGDHGAGGADAIWSMKY